MHKKIILLSVIISLLFIFPAFSQSENEESNIEEKTEQTDKKEQTEKKLETVENKEETKSEDEKIEEAVEKNLLDSKKALRLQYFGDEMLSVNAGKNGLREIVKIADDKMIMKKFDKKMRLTEEVTWICDSPDKSPDKLFKSTSYQYNGELFTPSCVTENFIVDSQKSVSLYNDYGKIISKTDYELVEENEKTFENESCKMTWKYDDENRIKEERTVKENFICYTKYIYHDDISKPDEFYYENSMLMKQKKYETEDVYYVTIYFDEATSVYSRYENDTKINEIYYVSGKEVRRREF